MNAAKIIAVKNTAIATVALFALLNTSTPAQAQSIRHLDARVVHLQRQAADLGNFLEAQDHRDGSSRRLTRQIRKVARKAGHVHQMILESAGRSHRSLWRHLQTDVRELDRLMQDAQATFAEMRHDRPIRHAQQRAPQVSVSFGHGWNVSFGSPRPNANRGHHYGGRSPRRQMVDRIEWKLGAMQRTLHYLKIGMAR